MKIIVGSMIFAGVLAMAGCASQPKDIPVQSVSTIQYEEYTCSQIGTEAERVSKHAENLYISLKQRADNDAGQMAIGMLIFWPTLFMLEGGDGPEAQEYARLRGEYQAIETVATKKSCGQIAKMKTPAEFEAERKAKEASEESDV